MKSITENSEQIKLVGITARTNNHLESDPSTAKIGPTAQNYFQNALAEKINDRVSPGVTYSVYTDYESDYMGDYTYFVGERVSSFDEAPEGMEQLTIPAQNYIKYTTESGPMPHVVIDAWKEIWDQEESGKLNQRTYKADFEVYDERAQDYQNAIVDIFIGVKE